MCNGTQRTLQDIRAQVRRMRGAYVEPTAVYLSDELYCALDYPQRVCGIQAEYDAGPHSRWAVR